MGWELYGSLIKSKFDWLKKKRGENLKNETKIKFFNGSTIIIPENVDAKVTRGRSSEKIEYFWELEEEEKDDNLQ